MYKRRAPFTVNYFMHKKTENLFSFAILILLIFYLTQTVINMEKNGLNHRIFSILTNGTIFIGSEPQKVMLIVMSLASSSMEGFVNT